MVLHDLPRAGIALEYAHAAFAPTADQAAERLLWHEVNSTLPRRFDGEQLLRPGPEVAAAVAGMVDDLIATFRRRAAMQGTRGLADPEGVKRRLLDRLLGMGYLAPFLQNPEYEEIIVNGPRLYVIGGGHKRLIEHIVPEPDETLHLIKRAIGPLGARLDESSPVVELGLPDGSRLTAVIPPMTDQIKLTIRKFVLRAQRLETLVALGTLPQDAASFLEAAVRAYVNILVTGPTGAGKCVTGDSLVTLADGGLRPIAELVEAAFSRHAAVIGEDGWASAPLDPANGNILTCDFAHGAMRSALGVTAWRHPAPPELIEVTLRAGQVLRTTPEHPFFTIVDGEIRPIRADQLQRGDRLASARAVAPAGRTPGMLDLLATSGRLYAANARPFVRKALGLIREREGLSSLRAVARALHLGKTTMESWQGLNAIPLPALQVLANRAGVPVPGDLEIKGKTSSAAWRLPSEPPVELTRLAGLVVGDGHLAKVSVELTSGDAGVRALFSGLAQELFGITPVLRSSAGKCPTLLLRSTVAVEVLATAYGIPRGTKARRVRAPAWLFSAPPAQIAAFLSGLLDSDGSVIAASAKPTAMVEFCTTSCGLADDIVALLLRLGVRSGLRRRREHGGQFLVQVYDAAALARLEQLLRLSHEGRRAALASLAGGVSQSSLDAIPGLAVPLRAARLAVGMTRAEYAAAFGLSARVLESYEAGWRNPRRARVLELASRSSDQALAARLRGLASQPVFWDQVASVRRLTDHGENYVYDLTVPGTHTFLAGAAGVVAHNTTLLNVLGAAIASDQERVVTLEDTPELTLHKTLPDCVPLYGRASNVEGAGAITYRKLMRTALRLRPTYLIVGEVRGAEALDMLVAMATGHASLGSLHAESPRGALEQLASFAQMAEEHPSREALAQTIAAHVQLVVQVRIDPETGKRRVVHIFEVTGPGEGAVIEGQDLWTLDGAGQLAWTGIRPRCLARIHGRGIAYDLPPVPLGRARGDHSSQDGRGGRP